MERGKPLYLNEERYAALTHMVWTSFAVVPNGFKFVC